MHFVSLASLTLPVLAIASVHAHPHSQIPMGNLKACEQNESTTTIIFNGNANKPKCVVIGTASDLSSNPISADKIAIANISQGKDASAKAVDPKKVVCTFKRGYSSNRAGELTVEKSMKFETATKITGIECELAS